MLEYIFFLIIRSVRINLHALQLINKLTRNTTNKWINHKCDGLSLHQIMTRCSPIHMMFHSQEKRTLELLYVEIFLIKIKKLIQLCFTFKIDFDLLMVIFSINL
jgi:hypothetical protein